MKTMKICSVTMPGSILTEFLPISSSQTSFHTKFMQLVEKNGGKAYNGAKMLLYQGVIAYELWTGVPVTEEQAEQVLAAMQEA